VPDIGAYYVKFARNQRFRFTNSAVTLFAASRVTVQVGSTPLQAPIQPPNVPRLDAVAVSVTVPEAGTVTLNVHFLPQLCPVSLTVTVPRFFFDTTT
jgi:hypothetical protein